MQCLVTFDRRDALTGISVPTLVLAGERDENAPADMMERMAAKIPGARFQVIPGAGHLAHFEQPMAFREALDGFLEKTKKQRAEIS
jgi:pimeloyl-ACP methyl ester carboxylesterase